MSSSRVGCAALAMVASALVVLQGCSGGGGGGGGSSKILLIEADGVAMPLWQSASGAPPNCPNGVFINSKITFTFGAAVSAASLPQSGLAAGSINISIAVTQQPAQGVFTIEDDPALPTGNQRRVVFRPLLPTNPNVLCAAGLAPSAIYNINVPSGGVVAGGNALQNSALTCFLTCGCPDPLMCASAFTDPVPGAPFVVMTTPPTSDPPPPGIDPATIPANTIQILVSEALNPVGIDLNNVRVINLATNSQVPGSLVFFQATSLPTLPVQSRIDYIASSPIAPNTTFQVVLSPSITDLAGHPLGTSQSNPAALLFFQTAGSLCPKPPFVETFDTTQHLGIISGALRWAGDGVLQAVFPLEITGTGSDGPFTPPANPTPVILDTNEMVGGSSRQGIWNFTTVNVPAGAVVQIIGPYQAHIRCNGTVTVNGIINANGTGGESGVQNNGAGTNCEALGGAANAGGGIGGTGSGITPPPGSPPGFQCTIRANNGEAGYGPTISGTLDTGVPPNPFYAGGAGGDSGCFPAAGPGCTTGDLGGLGGAGGTAARIGEAGQPRTTTAACLPFFGVTQPIAQPSQVPVVLIPPISVQSAGSGGGGGGDHWDSAGTPPNNDDQGGGGGGGGGGVRITSLGAYSQGNTGQILAQGGQGGTAQTFGGAGGSGSGGEIWIQTFSTVTIAATAVMNLTGPPRIGPFQGNIGCSNQASGGGGAGLVQIENGQGPPTSPNFMILPTPTPTSGAVFSNPPFAYGTTVTGHAESVFIYIGSNPDYTSVVEALTLGNAPNAMLTIRYEGVAEAINSTPQNPVFDPSTLKNMATGGGAITAANINELDGFAFIKFVVDVSFPSPPTTTPINILPSVDTITINFSGPCP